MKLISPHFYLSEFVPKEIYRQFGDNSIRFLDRRLIIVCEWIRVELDCPITINNWSTGGQFNYSGFRPPDCPTGAKLSAHKRGVAADLKIQGKTPKEVFEFIKANWEELKSLGLSTVEDIDYTISWNHISVEWSDSEELVIVRP